MYSTQISTIQISAQGIKYPIIRYQTFKYQLQVSTILLCHDMKVFITPKSDHCHDLSVTPPLTLFDFAQDFDVETTQPQQKSDSAFIFLIIQSQNQWSGRRRWPCLVWSLLER